MPSSHLILCFPLLLQPSIFLSIRVFFNESVLCIIWPKYWRFSFRISPSNEYSGLIYFRMDWFNLLAVQGTLKSLLQHFSSKASILQRSAFFILQLSHPYMTTGKTIVLTRQTFVSKVMSLLFHILFRFVIAFLPRSKCCVCLFVCLFNFMAAVTVQWFNYCMINLMGTSNPWSPGKRDKNRSRMPRTQHTGWVSRAREQLAC